MKFNEKHCNNNEKHGKIDKHRKHQIKHWNIDENPTQHKNHEDHLNINEDHGDPWKTGRNQ